MIFTAVEWYQPHVSVVDGVVCAIDQLVECSMVLAMSRNRVHIPWVCLQILDVQFYLLLIDIIDFNSIETNIEQISPALGDVQLNDSAFDSTSPPSASCIFLLDGLRFEIFKRIVGPIIVEVTTTSHRGWILSADGLCLRSFIKHGCWLVQSKLELLDFIFTEFLCGCHWSVLFGSEHVVARVSVGVGII